MYLPTTRASGLTAASGVVGIGGSVRHAGRLSCGEKSPPRLTVSRARPKPSGRIEQLVVRDLRTREVQRDPVGRPARLLAPSETPFAAAGRLINQISLANESVPARS